MYRTSLTAPIFGLRREIDRLFEDTFQNSGDHAGWVPTVNIRETANEFAFEVELAGLKPEEVEVTCHSGVLMIRGERMDERKEGDEARYHLVERSYGSFNRSFQLPQGVDDENIEANFENGLLRVRVPKAAIPRGEDNGGNSRKSASSEQKQRGEPAEQKPRGDTAGAGTR